MGAAAALICLVVAITDGDTVKVRCDEQPQQRVRLAEIDTPEKAQPFGAKAKQALSDLAYMKKVRMEVETTDRYGRLVAHLYDGDTHINAVLVEQGMAWCYRQYLKRDWCLPAEKRAKEAKRGLWLDAEPVPPWEWRRRK
jgi:endonuclease YncB( thermonuclease family)